MDKSYEFFLQLKVSPYADEWIAIVDEKVVAHGKEVKKVLAEAQHAYPRSRPLIAKIPGRQAMIL